MAVVVVDVDLTVVRSDLSWLAWLNYKSGESLTLEDCEYDYNLARFFPELTNPFKFWSQNDLYDDLHPIEGSVEILSELRRRGHSVIFASYCKKGHFGSKHAFLEKYFPFMEGFHATKEKHQLIADYFIDDRNEFLNKRVDGCKLIKYNTLYNQSESLTVDVSCVDSWGEVLNEEDL